MLLAEDGKKMRALAEKLVKAAEDGDVVALKEVGDRVDGKAMSALEISGSDGEPLRIVHESK